MQRKKNASEFTRHPSGHSAKPLTPNSLKQTRAFVITVRVTALSAITEELIMKLNIDLGKYVITGTKHDLILNEKRKVTDEKSKNFGNEVLVRCGYYSKFEHLVKELCHREILASEAQSFQELQKHIESLGLTLSKAVNSFVGENA
ncbi:replication initiation protein [Salmonella phage 103203_sal5]|nr:replication initiation protein [Salmonella phage 103203_sal5]ANM45135.1 hypothetical protein [Salmonella phage 146851_sal5]ANM45336.1 hypothetical protein [Salmonella phage 103203_sal5]